MIHWIFDLDNTLYRFQNQKNPSMNNILVDPKLAETIRFLPGNKLIFTNANHIHSMKMCYGMKMLNCFNAILNRDLLQGLKPDPRVYFKLIQWCRIANNDKVIFFEDTAVNLLIAKKFGWITVLISDKPVKKDFIDLCFPDTRSAISFIIKDMLGKKEKIIKKDK